MVDRPRIRRSSFINALLALCNTLNRRNIAPLSHRAGQPPPFVIIRRGTQLSVDWFLRGRNEAAGNYSETNRFLSWFVTSSFTTFASSFLLFFFPLFVSVFFSIVSLLFFFFQFSFLGWFSRLVWSSFFFFSLEIFFCTRSLFSPFSFLSPSPPSLAEVNLYSWEECGRESR